MFSRSTFFRQNSSIILAQKMLEDKDENLSARGEVPYHETICSKVYKSVFAKLDNSSMKLARLVCKKWHFEIFSLLEEKSCFCFRGTQSSDSDLTKAGALADFLKVVPRDGFQWKMLCRLYPNPEKSLPIPILIQWTHLRLMDCSFSELKPWLSRIHTGNITFLELQDVTLHWSKYPVVYRELENLKKVHDISSSLYSDIYREFEKGSAPRCKLQDCQEYKEIRSEDWTFFGSSLKHICIKRTRLEEVILHLKLISAMGCFSLESLSLSAQDCFGGADKSRCRKDPRLSEVKTILFHELSLVMKNNSKTLKELFLSFHQLTIKEKFDQYSQCYCNVNANHYKADLRDFVAYVCYHRWNEFDMVALKSLSLEFENRKALSLDEIEEFSRFIVSLKSLEILKISDILLTPANSPTFSTSFSTIYSKLKNSSYHSQPFFGIHLRNELNGPNFPIASTLNLNSLYTSLSSVILICNSNPEEDNLKSVLFASGTPADNMEHFWLIDNRPSGRTGSLLRMKQIVLVYPNLASLIIQDLGHSPTFNGKDDMVRWDLVDDYGMQLILKYLTNLRHLELAGNLIYLSDKGMVGVTSVGCERMTNERDFIPNGNEMRGVSFANLKRLQYCRLSYLGSKITDISAYLAFQDLPDLEYLGLFGFMQISPTGVYALRMKINNNKFKLIVSN